MARAYDRLVRLLDTHRPGDDPGALIELIPLARRRGDSALLARLARVFVDPATSTPPLHAYSRPPSREALCGRLEDGAQPPGPSFLVAEMVPDRAYAAAVAQGGLDAALVEATRRLVRAFAATRPGSPPLGTDLAEAAVCRTVLEENGEAPRGLESAVHRLVDRWVLLGGLERAVRIAARLARMDLTYGYYDSATATVVDHIIEARRPSLPSSVVARLWAWFRLEDPCPGRERVDAWLAPAELGTDEREATLALWLEAPRDIVEPLCRRLVASGDHVDAPGDVQARLRVIAALHPGQGEHLESLFESLQHHVPALCEVLPRVVDRLGAEALEALCERRANAGHHKYTGLIGQAIARIPGRETLRYFGMELGAKARTRSEDARTACLYHPVDAMLELPAQIATWVADTTRKGRADRKRAIEAATDVLTDELARLHPTAMWLMLPTIADPDLRDRVERAIPEAHRRDPDPDVVAEPFDTPEWLSSWPSAASARSSRYYDEAIGQACAHAGGLTTDEARRVAFALIDADDEHALRRARIDALLEHLDRETLVALATGLFDHWRGALGSTSREAWRLGFAAAVEDDALRDAVRARIAADAGSSSLGALYSHIYAVERMASRARWLDIVGSVRHTTRRPTLQRWLDERLQKALVAEHDRPVPLAFPLAAVDAASPWAHPLAEQLLETWMIQGHPVELDTLRATWLGHALFADTLRERTLWARVAGDDAPDEVVALDTGGLRDAPAGWYRPLHPVLVSTPQLADALTALRAQGREPLDWQAERAVWRDDALPFIRLAAAPAWALQLLHTRGRWVNAGVRLPTGSPHLTERMRYDDIDGAITLELTPQGEDLGSVVVRDQTIRGPVRRSEACVDLVWLADMPATGAALRAWREARGLSLRQAERRWRVRNLLAEAEAHPVLRPTGALLRAFWDERLAMGRRL